MKICIFEEMIADQETAFREICDFLEIPFYYERDPGPGERQVR